MKRLFSTLLLASCLFSFETYGQGEKQTATIEPSGDTYIYGGVITDHTPGRLKSAPFSVGAAVKMSNLKNNADYREAIIREYTSITTENAMKMSYIWKSRTSYNFSDMDYAVNFAQENGLRVHGHCLIWYDSKPDFITQLSNSNWGTKEDWKALMKEYISTVVGRHKGKIASWDVVNESIKDDGSERGEDIWRKHIGYPDYIDWAFQCAHEADPDALLFYNDYGYDYASAKRDKTDALIKGMLQRGIPIHGYGIQGHVDLWNRSQGNFKNYINRAANLGVMIHISEIDVKVNQNDESQANFKYTDELKKKQAGFYNEVSAVMSNLPEKQRFGVTQWNVADGIASYKSCIKAYLLDENFMPKTPAYDYFVKGFNGNYISWSQVSW